MRICSARDSETLNKGGERKHQKEQSVCFIRNRGPELLLA